MRRRAEQLLSLSRIRSGVGKVQGDGVALDEQEAVGALEGGDLTKRELGQVLGGFVVRAELEVVGRRDVVATDGGDCESLNRGGLVRVTYPGELWGAAMCYQTSAWVEDWFDQAVDCPEWRHGWYEVLW